jgi:hypothetical protein
LPTAQNQTKIAKEFPPMPPVENNYFLKSLLSKIFKTAATQAKQT